MRHFQKTEAPASFRAWRAQASPDWQPSYDDLQNPEKAELHQALLREQGGLCCYCGRAITQHDSHIEHFRPQQHYPERALDYANLMASCINKRERKMPLHCGVSKANDFDEALHLSPLDPTCESHFRYSLDGHIHANDACAKYMRDLLQLDIPFLTNRRQAALAAVFDSDFIVTASPEELKQLEAAWRVPDQDGQLAEFAHVLIAFAKGLY